MAHPGGPTLEASELQAVLGNYCLVHLPTITMMHLRTATRWVTSSWKPFAMAQSLGDLAGNT